ncbi:MAG: DUF58 domain-containing protein [Chloroflexota bacterium]|nr:DUF58 domain-containing protein [Chloroflexota bacterium]
MNKRAYYLTLAVILLGIPLHQPLLVIIGLLGLLIVLLTDAWSTYCLRDLHYRRQLSEQRVLFGEQVTLSFSIENAKLLPLPWVEVEDNIPTMLVFKGRWPRIGLRSNTAVVESLFSPRWYERITRNYSIQCNTRGIHAFGPTTLRSGDVFGFVTREASISNIQYLMVYPLVVPITRFGLPARRPFGDQRAPRRLLEDPSRVIGVRDYSYGDDMRRVHWKATARTMELQSKVYQATTTFTLVLFLNVLPRLNVHDYGIHPELQELAICVAASIADWSINEGYAVGLYANTMMYMPEISLTSSEEPRAREQEEPRSPEEKIAQMMKRRRIHIPPSSNEEQRKRIMEVLARIQSYYGTSIEDVILAERTRLPAGATVVVVTSSISELLLDALARVRRAGHAVTILFVGDAAPSVRFPGITVHHIGGEETWKALEALYDSASEDEESMTQKPEVLAGIQL